MTGLKTGGRSIDMLNLQPHSLTSKVAVRTRNGCMFFPIPHTSISNLNGYRGSRRDCICSLAMVAAGRPCLIGFDVIVQTG